VSIKSCWRMSVLGFMGWLSKGLAAAKGCSAMVRAQV
jgi:hypothetical protein